MHTDGNPQVFDSLVVQSVGCLVQIRAAPVLPFVLQVFGDDAEDFCR